MRVCFKCNVPRAAFAVARILICIYQPQQFLTRHSVAIAVVSVIAALAASAIDADSISIPAAFIALGAVYYETEIKEGDES